MAEALYRLIQVKARRRPTAKNRRTVRGNTLDILSVVIAVPLIALTGLLLVGLPLAIMGNLRRGQQFREGLDNALEQLRLSKMLGFLGIDRKTYVHRQQGLAIRQQLQRCETCDAKAQCDEILDSDAPQSKADLGFCANIDELDKLRDKAP